MGVVAIQSRAHASCERNLGSKLNFPVDPKTCSSAGSATAWVPIVDDSGTGAYHGISGRIRTTATVASILMRNGQCAPNATQYPGVLFGKGSGTVSFK
jgi:hypothetical protein